MNNPAGQPVRAIGFDLGETLLTYRGTPMNWVALYPAALDRVAGRLGVTPDAAQMQRAGAVLARYNTRLHPRTAEIGAETIFAEVLACWPRTASAQRTRDGAGQDCEQDSRDLREAIAAFFDFFQQRLMAYPESLSALGELRGRGVRIGVLTDVPYGMPRAFVERDLAQAGLLGLVDVLLTSVDTGTRKPDPSGFHALAAALGVETHALIYVGNEPKDITGPLAAGAKPVWIDREKAGGEHGQWRTVHGLDEVAALFTDARKKP